MDIKGQINNLMEEISKNPNIKEQFEKEPVLICRMMLL